MASGTTEIFSSGFETASLVASSGLLSSPWNLIAHLTAETHPNQNLFWKKLSNNGSDLTIIAFGTTLKHVQPDLVRSTDTRNNPFEFLCSMKNPSFSLNKSAVSLFNDHSHQLDQLKSETDLKKPVIVTGHGVGGSIASLFTLWLIEKMGSSDKCPLCITFGSPLIGDKCLQEAISQSSRCNSCFLHLASHRDPLVSAFISDDSYRPFGTFLLCSDCGSTCSENPDSILRLLKEMSTPDQGLHQFQGYGNIVEKLTSQAICKDADVPNIPQNPLQAGLALQMQVLGFSNSQLSQNNLVKDLERQEVLLTLNKRQRFMPHKKLDGMKINMALLEWYKKCGKRRGGYYDSFKCASTRADLDSAMDVRVLNNYWKCMVEEVDKEPLKGGTAFRTRWLYAGTNYRRLVEPLDIAQYYGKGGEDYINKGRSKHYKLLQKWQEEEQKKRLEEDKKTEPLNRKINVQAILTWDSCFWAHVEEAILSLKTCKDASSNVVEKQEAMKRLEEFEEYVYGLLKNYTVSPDIFLEGSNYMRWWNDYIKFKGSSHRSSLANFMTNYVMYETGEYDLGKDNSSLTWDLVKDALAIVGEGTEYKSSRKNLEAVVKDLSPLVEKIEQSMKQMDLQREHVQKLKDMLAKNREGLGKHKIPMNFVLVPWSQSKLSREHTSLERFVSVQTQIQMLQLLTEILSLQSSHRQSLGSQTSSAPKTHNHRTQIFPPRFTVGLDGSYMAEVKAMLLDANEQVLNLYGLPGSGKTTMAKKLCHDLEAEGKFREIVFRTLGSQPQSDEAIKMLKDELSQCGEGPILLVLDDVWPHSQDIVEKIYLRSSDSRILVTSRAQMRKVTSRCQMKLLSDQDAEELLCSLIQPSGVDFNDRATRKILRQILECCNGLPLALEFIGRKIASKNGTIEAFQEVLLEWSRGGSTLDSREDLLARLQSSVDESIRDCFMDLGLFPEDQKIPITSLIDMWTELHDLNEPASSSAFLIIQELIAMNLAAGVLVRRKIGWDYVDNYYNNYDLVQYDLFRELAIHMSQQEPLEKRSRLIIDLYGNQNQPPKWWPTQQPIVVSPPILSISTDQNINPDWCNIQAAATVVLILNLRTSEYTLPGFIREMEKLKVLIVTNYGYSKTYLRNLQLLGSLLSLKRIRLQKVSIPSLYDLKNVHKLSLYMCDVKEAFENNSVDFSEAMRKLEDLSIEYCHDLVRLPTGSCHIHAMKNLTISSCHNFIGLPEEIGKLENLEILRVNLCSSFEELPHSITELKNLSLLDISFCVMLRKLPDKIGKLQNLTKLYMTGCSIQELPDSIIDLNKLESVICDEYAFPLWEVITSSFSRLNITMADMDVDLDWLS